jgi:hypothetical protein
MKAQNRSYQYDIDKKLEKRGSDKNDSFNFYTDLL